MAGSHPRTFDRLYINMVKAGEAGGVLDTVLERLSVFMEKAVKIMGKVVGDGLSGDHQHGRGWHHVSVLMVFVVPKFQEVFFTMLKGQAAAVADSVVLAIADAMRKQITVSWWWPRGGDYFVLDVQALQNWHQDDRLVVASHPGGRRPVV
jgi:type IV pilus assembly protein PilC